MSRHLHQLPRAGPDLRHRLGTVRFGRRAWLAGNDRRLSAIGGAGGVALIGLGFTVAAGRN